MPDTFEGKPWTEASKIILLALLKRADPDTLDEIEAALGSDVAPEIAVAIQASRRQKADLADGMFGEG